MSFVFGQRFKSLKQLDPRPDRVISFWLERVGLGIPGHLLAWMSVAFVGTPEIRGKHVNYKGKTEGVPLFTSPTLNISRLEVGKRG